MTMRLVALLAALFSSTLLIYYGVLVVAMTAVWWVMK